MLAAVNVQLDLWTAGVLQQTNHRNGGVILLLYPADDVHGAWIILPAQRCDAGKQARLVSVQGPQDRHRGKGCAWHLAGARKAQNQDDRGQVIERAKHHADNAKIYDQPRKTVFQDTGHGPGSAPTETAATERPFIGQQT